MKIHNVRAGFATNSSSSHSIIMIPRGSRVKDWDVPSDMEYGWDNFWLASNKSKSDYFATQLVRAMELCKINVDVAVELVNDWMGGKSYVPDQFAGYGVDHQSQWYLGEFENWDTDFVQCLYAFLMRSDVVILGGNDNSDGCPEPKGAYSNTATHNLFNQMHNDVRRDGDNWCVFHRGTGTKFRFSADENAPPYVKSTLPELVDLKLTSFCRYGCEFCYQASTTQGQHATMDNIRAVVDACAGMKVFELAIGGGEPTHHPQFGEILEYIGTQTRIVPNFTTFGVDWLNNHELVEMVVRHVGAVGVSVHTAKHLDKVNRIQDALGISCKVTAQHVVGSVDLEETALLLEESWSQGIDVLLLGYKNVGFGARHQPHNMDTMDTLLRLRQNKTPHWNANISMLGVDTAFVQQFAPVLEELKIPLELMASEEGKFSMYVDAVEMQQGPSSYMPDQMCAVDVNNAEHSMRQAFAQW
jgi:Radical SAM superfamily